MRHLAGILASPCIALCLCLYFSIFSAGCDVPGGVDEDVTNQSLVEIGENSLEQAESLESRGDIADANMAYRKALWAFRYHQQLTREEPLLLDDALEGVKRTSQR